MSDESKSIIILIIACFFFFVVGLLVGFGGASKAAPSNKEILELNIELTKLRIKELKEANNG